MSAQSTVRRERLRKNNHQQSDETFLRVILCFLDVLHIRMEISLFSFGEAFERGRGIFDFSIFCFNFCFLIKEKKRPDAGIVPKRPDKVRWWIRQGSNLRPRACEARALTN